MKRLFKINLFLLALILKINTINSQGLVFDSLEFSKRPSFAVDRSILPDRSSLENYLPVLVPQSGGTCVAMSIALARTIMYAYSNRITDPYEILINSFSPYFVYYVSRPKYDYSCSSGLDPFRALDSVKKYGIARFANVEYPNYFPITGKKLCPNNYNFFPPDKSNHFKNAQNFKISNAYVTSSINGIKSALAKKIPVIVAMQLPNSFYKPSSILWKSLSDETRTNAFGHAMVAIGYDDNLFGGAIRIANSWGENWGDNGKIWITYNELQYWLDGGFIMTLPSQSYRQDISINNENPSLNYKNFKMKEFDGKVDFDNSRIIDAFKKYQPNKN